MRTGARPAGPIRLLAHLRTWGWAFNPIAFYLAFDETGDRVETLMAEVTNTPWHERTAYVLPVSSEASLASDGIRFAKALHVSPFMDMDLDHVIRMTRPGEDFAIRMDDWRGDEQVFAAELALRRLPLDRSTMGAALRRHPLPAQRVSAGIYWQALKLRAKGAPFRRHPSPCPARPDTEAEAMVASPCSAQEGTLLRTTHPSDDTRRSVRSRSVPSRPGRSGPAAGSLARAVVRRCSDLTTAASPSSSTMARPRSTGDRPIST